MKPRTWLLQTIGIMAVFAAAAVSLNMYLDIYGIFRAPQGRHLTIYGDERIAKYLLSEKYVPGNFNALLIGSSVSGNWNTGQLHNMRVYNESLNGGNIVEEKSVADQALARHRIHFAIVIVHPFLTSSHGFETVRLTPRENSAALGSESLLDAYKEKVRIRFHHGKPRFDEFGTDDFGDAPKKLNATLQKMMAPGSPFEVDEIARKSYSDLISELHFQNIPIVFVIPPVSEQLLVSKRAAFDLYSKTMLAETAPQDKVIDFTSDTYRDFRGDPNNFVDGIHLRPNAAQKVMSLLDQQLQAWIANGQLAIPAKPSATGRD